MQHTYWYHPESDCYVIVPANELDAFCETAEGMLCHEVPFDEYLRNTIRAIDEDPNHVLPKDVCGILKNAKRKPHGILSGEIWYRNGIPNGTGVDTLPILEEKPGGIYCTERNSFLVSFEKSKGSANGRLI